MTFNALKTFLVPGLALMLAAGCTQKEQKAAAPKPLDVTVLEVSPQDVPEWREVMGKTEGEAQVEIRSQVTGTLKKIAYSEGERVRPGQLLFLIDPAPYDAALKEAKAQKAEAAAAAEKAERELKRTQALAANQAVPAKELDDAISADKSAKASLAAADARLEDAAVDLSHTRVSAPSAGIAGLSLVNPGALVTQQSTLLTTLTQKSELRVVFAMSDRDLAGAPITRGNAVEVVNTEGTRLPASLDYVSQAVEPALGTRQMRAKLASAAGLLSGQYVRVRLQTGIEKGVYLVPQSAVLQQSNGTYAVYTAADGKAKKVEVTVGPWNSTDWIVRSGLKPGDQVIVDQILRLRDGRRVAPHAPAPKDPSVVYEPAPGIGAAASAKN